MVAAFQDERRLRQPGEHAARHHLRLARDGGMPLLQRDPVRDQHARLRPRHRHVGGAQVPQPAEAVQRRRPDIARRVGNENGAAADVDDLAAEIEKARIDFVRRGGVGGTQVRRCDQEPVGHARKNADAGEHGGAQAIAGRPQRLGHRKIKEPPPTGGRCRRHYVPASPGPSSGLMNPMRFPPVNPTQRLGRPRLHARRNRAMKKPDNPARRGSAAGRSQGSVRSHPSGETAPNPKVSAGSIAAATTGSSPSARRA